MSPEIVPVEEAGRYRAVQYTDNLRDFNRVETAKIFNLTGCGSLAASSPACCRSSSHWRSIVTLWQGYRPEV